MLVFHWSDEIVEHLAEHDVTPEEFEEVVRSARLRTRSRSSHLPAVSGWTRGRHLFCVYRLLTPQDIEPVTAYEVGR